MTKKEKYKIIYKKTKKMEEKKMKKTKRMIRNLIIFIILIILTFYIILKDQNITEIFSIFQNVKKQYILIAILSMCIYVVCEAINIGRTLKNLNEKSTF